MKRLLLHWLKANKAILLNAGSLVGTWGVTSGLGFVYWLFAARGFQPQEVGIGSAAISAMTLLGTFCLMGLGTLLITEIPRQPEKAGSLISIALIVVALVGGGIGILFALLAPVVSANYSPLRANVGTVMLFALGVSLTSITLILDQALIGLLRGGLQLWRNGIFAFAKLAILLLLSLWFAGTGGIGIYATWAAGNALSLLVLLVLVLDKKRRVSYRPQWSLLSSLWAAALQHHALNMVLSAPILFLPLLVTVMLSAQANAWFYVAWMLVNILFVIPGALTMVLHAVNSAQQATLQQRARATLGLAFLITALSIGVIAFGARELLNFFGASYAAGASGTLQILALGAFPIIIRNHYISISRIQDRITPALLGILPGAILELVGAALGAYSGGLIGLSTGWVIALCVEAIFMCPAIYKAVFIRQKQEEETKAEPVWLMETALLPSIGSGYAGSEPLWLMNSALQPAIGKNAPTESVWLMETKRMPAIRPDGKGGKAMKKARLEAFQEDDHHVHSV